MYAQRADVWVFGWDRGLNFNTEPPSLFYPDIQFRLTGTTPAHYSSSISDCDGQLLFYSSSCQIWNKNQQPMKNGILVGNCNLGIPGALGATLNGNICIPCPNDSNLYYVISSVPYSDNFYYPGRYKGLHYSIVNMSLDSGLGAVDSSRKNIQIDSFATMGLCIAKHANNKDYWLLSKPDNKYIFAYLVTDSMISTYPVMSVCPGNLGYSQIKVSHDNKQLVCTDILPSQSMMAAILFDFNSSTGKLTNPRPLITQSQIINTSNYIQAVEFSPNDSLIYLSLSVTHPPGNPANSKLLQVERFASSIPSTMTIINDKRNIRGLQIGPDNKIYSNDGTNIGVIHNPNKKGKACNFVYNEHVPTAGYRNGETMPTLYFPTYNLEFIVNKPLKNCYNDSVKFINISDTHFISYTWVFGDGDSLTVPDKRSIWHTYKNEGMYYVYLLGKINSGNFCNANNRFGDTVIINLKPKPGFITDSLSIRCLEQEIFVTDTTNGSILSVWDWGDSSVFDTGKVASHIYTESDTFKITLYSFNQNCMDTTTKTVIISINPNPKS